LGIKKILLGASRWRRAP